MLKIKINGEKGSIRKKGKTIDIMAEVGAIVQYFYAEYKKESPALAELFRAIFTDPDSPVFKD